MGTKRECMRPLLGGTTRSYLNIGPPAVQHLNNRLYNKRAMYRFLVLDPNIGLTIGVDMSH